MNGLTRAAAIATIAVAASSCTTQVAGTPTGSPQPQVRLLDHALVEDSVRRILVQYYDIADPEITSISCPSGQKVEVGNAFDCAVSIVGVAGTSVTVTVTDVYGAYEIGRPE
jgi:hypothetical protein